MAINKEAKERGLAMGVELGIYTDDETEFIKAVEAWKKRTRRRFPAITDYLRIAQSIGYQKCPPAK